MPFQPPADYWLEIPAGRYRVGLTRDEAHSLAEQSAAWFKHKGIDLSPNEGKMMRQAAEMLDTTGNAPWVEQYLLAHYPAREVDLPAFAIARQPITNKIYRQFMAETGDTQEPDAWYRSEEIRGDDRPAAGLSWWQCLALARWAGARIPFEHEWERAVRGPAHHLFPWGNTHAPLGRTIDETYEMSVAVTTTRTAEGLEGALCGHPEWCADLWTLHEGLDPSAWGADTAPAWARTLRGEGGVAKTILSGVTRSTPGLTSYSYRQDNTTMRLIRADPRAIPPPHPDTPTNKLAMERVRDVDSTTVHRVLGALRDSPLGREHTIELGIDRIWNDLSRRALARAALSEVKELPRGIFPASEHTWTIGGTLIATSKESIRRIPTEHGVFVWSIQYRLADDGSVRARPVTVFRMAFDKGIHRFEWRFRADEADSAVTSLTPELVRANVLDTFGYYELHADSDANPFAK